MVLSTSGLLKTASTLSTPPSALTGAGPGPGPSPSPSPCHSVWHVRRPDGTAYPHQRLALAAAALEGPESPEEAPATFHLLEREGGLPGQGGAGGDAVTEGGVTGTGGGGIAGTAADVAYSVPLEEGAGFARGLAGAGGGGGGGAGGEGKEGGGFWVMVAVGSAVAAAAVALKGLFGNFGNSTPPGGKEVRSVCVLSANMVMRKKKCFRRKKGVFELCSVFFKTYAFLLLLGCVFSCIRTYVRTKKMVRGVTV